ncbi:exocyst complex component Sec6 [Aulographum hederae CBS 113979]|uniref:Exocyst complex component Sec6 n=1 Tax=Aulographum hederae CBS 113979 TaxID=1176131 RepID=A0A6G1H7A7_9PEZI|nr:exocyst complex component Sec6 [Aulographum hederae CBS 113979]
MNDAEAITVKLAELLRHPEDLDKIHSLKSEFTRKKAAVDSQLRLGLAEQLAITKSGMTNISDGQRTVNLIKDEMMKIDKLCAEAQNMIRDFPHINLVAQTHRNFAQVEAMKADVDSFDRRLEEIAALLEEDQASMQDQPNLLRIHFELTKLRDIRDAALDQVKGQDDSAQELINNLRLTSGETLQDLFARLDDVVVDFDDHVGSACMDLIPLVAQGFNGLVVRLALIIEEEEKSDKKVKALQDAQREYKELASKFKSITAGPKELRGYKDKFIQAIKINAEKQQEVSDEAFLEDPDKLEKSVRWFFNDLNTVKLGMVPLMPKKWKIFETYVRIYHNIMHDWLVSRIDDDGLIPPQMLAIVNWEEKYYAKMKKLGASVEWLTPHIIDNRGTDLVRDYRQLIVKAVEEWMERMSSSDRRAVSYRTENMLDNDENNLLRTKTMGDMWRMLREQLMVAESSQRTDVVEGVVEAMFAALTARQRMWEALINTELQKYQQPNSEQEGLNSFQDWLVAIANDQIACIDDAGEDEDGSVSYLTRFTRDVSSLVSPAYADAIAPQIDALQNGYVDLSTHCLSVFASLIFAVDFRSLMPDFFTPAWYGKKGVGQAISTFEDYMADYKDVLHPSLRDVLVEELADELLVRYLSSVRNKGVKFRRTDPFTEKIRDDVVTCFGYFEQFPAFADIREKWRVVDYFVRLLETEKAGVPEVYEEFKTGYWDAGIGWVEQVLRCRDDFDRGMLNAVKARAAAMEVVRGPETIMGKVK